MKCANFVIVFLVIETIFVGQSIASWSSGLASLQASLNQVSSNFPAVSSLTSSLSSSAGNAAQNLANTYDSNIKFSVSNSQFSLKEWNHATESLSSIGCNKNGKFTFVVHGWRGFVDVWTKNLVNKFVQYRGGCVIAMNWNYYAKNSAYPYVVANTLPEVAHLLRRKLDNMVKEGISPDNIHLFGHSLGARMVLDAGLRFGSNRLESVDACDPAGAGYLVYDLLEKNDFKKAAKNVQCIHTSSNFGTFTRNCHQDWLMGDCGNKQPGANDLMYSCQTVKLCTKPEIDAAYNSHNRCYDFYTSAFETDFIPYNKHGCSGTMNLNSLPSGFKMGYRETRKSQVRGILPCPTTATFPYYEKEVQGVATTANWFWSQFGG